MPVSCVMAGEGARRGGEAVPAMGLGLLGLCGDAADAGGVDPALLAAADAAAAVSAAAALLMAGASLVGLAA